MLLCLTWAFGVQAQPKTEAAKPRDLTKVPIMGEDGAPDKWAVVIGVSRHREKQIDLQFAAADARAMAVALEKHGGFAPDHIKVLVDGDATAMNIRTTLGTWLPQVARRNDLVVIYFSGHGSPDLDPNVEDGIRKYLIPHDADPSNLFATAVPMDDLSSALMRLKSERTVVFLDCCYSGGGLPTGAADLPRTFHRSGLDVTGRLNSGFIDAIALSGRGRAVLTASDPNEKSWEYRELGHGAFTYHLLQGLAGKAANPQNGTVGVSDLYAYVWEKLGDAKAKHKQTPMMSTTVAGVLTLTGKKTAEGSATGTLKVVTSPLDAEVFLDRDPAPLRTPLTKEVTRGLHRIAIYKNGYLPITEDIYVASGRVTLANYVLKVEESRGDLLIVAPPGAQIKIGAQSRGEVGPSGLLRLPDLDARDHVVRIEAAGFEPREKTVSVQAGRPVVERFELQKTLAGRRAPGDGDIVAGLKRDGEKWMWEKDGAEMVFVSEGAFLMGSEGEDEARPRHEKTVGAFWIDRHEVTNAQFARFVGESGHKVQGAWTPAPADRANHPVTKVTLPDARAYAKWAGKIVPGEAQWEKAARGSDGRRYPYGETYNQRHQNIRAYGYKSTLDVGSLAAGESPYGARDILGNVWEWCDSPFVSYAGNPVTSPNFDRGAYTIRGGSYLSPALKESLSVATRSFLNPNIAQEDVGFRCATPAK